MKHNIDWRSPRTTWMGALIAPFVMQFSIIGAERASDHFLVRLPFYLQVFLMYGMVVVPSYVLLFISRATWEKRLIYVAVFSALLLVLVPALYFFGVVVACEFYHWCE